MQPPQGRCTSVKHLLRFQSSWNLLAKLFSLMWMKHHIGTPLFNPTVNNLIQCSSHSTHHSTQQDHRDAPGHQKTHFPDWILFLFWNKGRRSRAATSLLGEWTNRWGCSTRVFKKWELSVRQQYRSWLHPRNPGHAETQEGKRFQLHLLWSQCNPDGILLFRNRGGAETKRKGAFPSPRVKKPYTSSINNAECGGDV